MIIAEARSRNGQTNFSIRTTPGRSVGFRACLAQIEQMTDMPFVLRQEGIVVTVKPERIDWLPGWMDEACQGTVLGVQADLDLPEGYSVELRDGSYVLLYQGQTQAERFTEPEEPEEPERRKPGRPKKTDALKGVDSDVIQAPISWASPVPDLDD